MKLSLLFFIALLSHSFIILAQQSSTVLIAVYSGLVEPNGTNTGGPLAGQGGNKNRGFLTFDLKDIPDHAVILQARLLMYTNSSTNTPEEGNFVVGISVTPTLDNFEAVQVTYQDANDGPVFTEGATWAFSYNTFELNKRAVAEIQSKVGKAPEQSLFSCALKAAATTSQSWNFHGYNVSTDPLKARLELTYDELNTLPQAKFGADKRDILPNETVNFKDSSTNNPTSWSWDFDIDGSPGTLTSTLQNPAVTFVNPGKYSVSLAVSNASGSNMIIETGYITVYNIPLANFGYRVNDNQPTSVEFFDSTQFTPVSWRWDFGDGDTSASQNPIHLYASKGVYQVCLIASNIAGSDTICKQVNATDEEVGLVNYSEEFMAIYPNPSEGKFIVKQISPAEVISVFNSRGKVILRQSSKDKMEIIDLSACPEGIYFYMITDKKGRTLAGKIIRN